MYLIVQFVVSIPQCFKRRLYVCIFNSKYIYAMCWYMCESMEVVSACVAHVCGVCNTVHKYVHSLLCVLFYMLLLLSSSCVSIFSNGHVCYFMRCFLYFVTITVTPMKFALSCVLFHALPCRRNGAVYYYRRLEEQHCVVFSIIYIFIYLYSDTQC